MGKIQEIRFQTKEESNRLQEEEFLKLSPQERLFRFFELCYLFNQFPLKDPQTKSNNFEIIIPLRK